MHYRPVIERDKTIAEKFVHIHKHDTQINPNVETFRHLAYLLNQSNNKNSINVPRVVKPTNRKTLFETLGTSVINGPKDIPPWLMIPFKVCWINMSD